MALTASYVGDEASGSVIDGTGNGHDFALVGNSQRTAAASGYLHGGTTPASKGLTQSSNGTDAGPSLFGQTTARSLSMWLKMAADFTGWVFEWHLNGPNSGAWGLLCLSGQLGFRARNAGANTAFASAARITDAAWHHYTGTWDGTSVRFYTDGVLTATSALTGGGPIATADIINLFNVTVGTTPIADDIRVHDHALSAAEILAFMGNAPPDSAGSNYSQTPSDAEGLTDTVALSLSRGISDNANPSDVASQTVNQIRADSLGLTDAAALALSTTSADNEGLTDSAALVRTVVQVQTEDSGLTDSFSVLRSGVGDLAVTDTENLTDSASVSLSAIGTPTDPAGTSDTTTTQVGKVAGDTESLTDAAGLSLGRPISDIAGVVDSVFIELTTTAVLADSLGMTDQMMIKLELAVLDQMALDDSVEGLPVVAGRDLTLAGEISAGRFGGSIAAGRFSGSIEPGRWEGKVTW